MDELGVPPIYGGPIFGRGIFDNPLSHRRSGLHLGLDPVIRRNSRWDAFSGRWEVLKDGNMTIPYYIVPISTIYTIAILILRCLRFFEFFGCSSFWGTFITFGVSRVVLVIILVIPNPWIFS